MTYRVLYKRFSDLAGGGKGAFILVEESIEATDYSVGSDGTLTFYRQHDDPERSKFDTQPFFTIPPTFWFIVEPADKTFAEPRPSLVQP